MGLVNEFERDGASFIVNCSADYDEGRHRRQGARRCWLGEVYSTVECGGRKGGTGREGGEEVVGGKRDGDSGPK